MKQLLHPSLVPDARRPCMPHKMGLNKPIQIVLETRQQQLPWNPVFGCDLTSLIYFFGVYFFFQWLLGRGS